MIVGIAAQGGAVAVTITSALTPFSRVVTACHDAALPPPAGADWYVSFATILPPSCFHRASNACTTFLKYTITVSVASAALRQPFAHANSAIAEPSSWATLPNVNARRALRAEALRPHLVRADARRDREHAAVDRLLDDRGGEIDVAGREDDVGALAEQLRRTRLRDRRLVALRIARDDLRAAARERRRAALTAFTRS